MKLLILNPVGTEKWNQSDRELFSKYASPEAEIYIASLERGPASLVTRKDYADALPLVVEKALRLCKDYDGLLVNCFLDPGVDVLKSLLEIPVVGPCEASLAVASLLGWKLGVVTVEGEGLSLIEERIRLLGFGNRLASLRYIDVPVLELDADLGRTKGALLRESKIAVEEGAEVVVLGCTGLAGLAEWLSGELGVPVVDPALAALKMLETLVKLGLRQSERRYRY